MGHGDGGGESSKEGQGEETYLSCSHFCFIRWYTGMLPSIGENGVGYLFHGPLWKKLEMVS